jgi:hypothetical protein
MALKIARYRNKRKIKIAFRILLCAVIRKNIFKKGREIKNCVLGLQFCFKYILLYANKQAKVLFFKFFLDLEFSAD